MMFSLLCTIIIGPIEFIIETFYAFLSTVVRYNYGFSILGISIIVSFLCLPLYARAEHYQEEERRIQKKISKKTASIKSNFRGDERYFILSAYYRENHYHPLMALRGSFSLLIQIPFFIAAYHFISGLEVLKGESFLFIPNLGESDSLLKIGNTSINMLPVLMTLINVVSGMIYAKGFPLKEKIQLYGISVIFLFLLYNSPSALVIYWTCNNIFSLFKNVIYKTKKPLLILYLIVAAGLFLSCLYVAFFRSQGRSQSLLFTLASAGLSVFILLTPLYIRGFKFIGKKHFSRLKTSADFKKLFFAAVVLTGLLCAVFIPFNIVASDPAEFVFSQDGRGPFSLLLPPLSLSLGLFVFWPVYIYLIAGRKIKLLLSFLAAFTGIFGIINTFVFSGSYGMLSRTLNFTAGTGFSGTPFFYITNILAGLVLLTALFLLYRSNGIKILSLCCTIIVLSLAVLSLRKAYEIKKGYDDYKRIAADNETISPAVMTDNLRPVLNLSKNGKNVVIIMLDKAIGSYFPLIIEEKNALAESFKGFVYYPNTLSFFRATILGAPPLFGGYEYSPEKLQERNREPMAAKHNEAYLMLPTLFRQHGWAVSIFDLPYFNYQKKMDIHFLNELGIRADNLDGKYDEEFRRELGNRAPAKIDTLKSVFRRNAVMFSIFSISPAVLRGPVYNKGNYWSADNNSRVDIVTGSAFESFAVLHYLPQLTDTNETSDTLTILVSNMAHDPSFLQYPDYSIASEIDDYGPDRFNGNINSFQYYHVNAASYLLLAKWFDFLKAQEVYDNTRIIIVSDHAESVVHPYSVLDKKYTSYNPILLVKDFYAKEDMRTDMTFMTNADTPLIAVRDLIVNARNPFTNTILTADKENGINVFLGGSSQPQDYKGTDALDKTSRFYHVKDTIFDEKNWTKVTKQVY